MGPPDTDKMDIDPTAGVEETKQSGEPKPEVTASVGAWRLMMALSPLNVYSRFRQ